MSPILEMRVFIVRTSEYPTLHASRIEAAYYKSEQGFTTFKDTENQPVLTVRDDHLVSVKREYAAEPVIAAFTEALQEADLSGSATVGFRNGDTAETETGYDITVTRFGGASAPVLSGSPVTGSAELAAAVRKASERNDAGHA
jgi:hypothetical protein